MMQLHEAAVFAMDAATPTALSSPDHGPRHWHDVGRIGNALIEVSLHMGADRDHIDSAVVFLFAVLHDTQRLNEFNDPDHGNRAEDVARTMRDQGVVTLTDTQFDLLTLALGDHDRGYAHRQPTVAVCWDADRLTLPRVGIDPDPKLMSSVPARTSLEMCMQFARAIMDSHDLPWSEIVSLYEGRLSDPARTV